MPARRRYARYDQGGEGRLSNLERRLHDAYARQLDDEFGEGWYATFADDDPRGHPQVDGADSDYLHWRAEQMKKLDAEYEEWRKERRQKFAEEFDKWRSGRRADEGR